MDDISFSRDAAVNVGFGISLLQKDVDTLQDGCRLMIRYSIDAITNILSHF